MLALIAFLFVAFLILNIVVMAIRWFWSFLGKGKPLKHAIEEGLISAETEKAIRDAEIWRAMQGNFFKRKKKQRASKKAGKTGRKGAEPVPAPTAEAVSTAVDEAAAEPWQEPTPEAEPESRPKLTWSQRLEVVKADLEYRDRYLDKLKLSAYQVIIIFVIGSILGLVIEEIWMYATAGLTEGRYGLVWGPFSPLYGAGAVILTLVCWPMRKKHVKWWVVFLVSVVVGGCLEQFTGWSMMTLFHAESWSYLHLPDHITQWVAWRFLFFWGLIGLFWNYVLMPTLVYGIGQPTTRRQIVFITVLTVYLAADITMTLMCFQRSAAREAGIPPQNAFDQWVDTNYDDEFIANRFQNLTIDHDGNGDSSNSTGDDTSSNVNANADGSGNVDGTGGTNADGTGSTDADGEVAPNVIDPEFGVDPDMMVDPEPIFPKRFAPDSDVDENTELKPVV